jgi:DNA processing protein
VFCSQYYILRMQITDTTHHARAGAYAPPSSHSLIELPGCRQLHVAGDVNLVGRTMIAVIGSRQASDEALACAAEVAVELVARGYVVLSGLAAGIDAAAHRAALGAGGRTVAVIGTSLDQVYPAQHAALQERVYREHLLVSPFAAGSKTARWHFPARNRVMARLALATVLVEATEESGTRHQVAECLALGRTVFARRGLVDTLSWLRGVRAGAVVEWGDATDLGARVAACGAGRAEALA